MFNIILIIFIIFNIIIVNDFLFLQIKDGTPIAYYLFNIALFPCPQHRKAL